MFDWLKDIIGDFVHNDNPHKGQKSLELCIDYKRRILTELRLRRLKAQREG